MTMYESIWSRETALPEFKKADGDISADVLIIGGGLCGLLCAYHLGKAGVDYVLAEGRRICDGTTKNTTAKLTAQHGLIYAKLIKSMGREKAKQYLEANLRALEKYEELCKGTDCGFEKKSAYAYSVDNRQKIEEEVAAVSSLGFKAEFREKTKLPFDIAGAVEFPRQAQFNPLKFAAKISNGLNIFENTFIKGVEGNVAVSDTAKIKAQKIIVATHFPFINSHGGYYLRLYQSRSYVAALENAPDVEGMYVDEISGGISLRNYEGLLLVGGGGGRTGKPREGREVISRFVRKYCPDAKLTAQWAAQDCISLDKVPYIGHYSKNTSDLYVATGFNKWGMTSSMAAAEILTDMVLGKKNEYAEVFLPQRSSLKSQLLVNAAQSTAGLITPSTKRCTHMGCALKHNRGENSWDCPCHGSRFTEGGAVIDNPAMRDAKV